MEQQCHNQGQGNRNDQNPNIQVYGITEIHPELLHTEQTLKVVQTDPGTLGNSHTDLNILKGHQHAVHRIVLEQDRADNTGNAEEIEFTVSPNRHPFTLIGSEQLCLPLLCNCIFHWDTPFMDTDIIYYRRESQQEQILANHAQILEITHNFGIL